MLTSRLNCSVIIIFLAVVPLHSPRAQNIDADKLAAIRELLKITGAQADSAQLTKSLSQQLIGVLRANNTQLSNEDMEMITHEVGAVVGEQLTNEVLQKKIYRVYARYFTLEDIQSLIEFNKSPAGRKANRVMPTLMRETKSETNTWVEEVAPEITRRVSEKLKQEGIRVGS